MRYTGSADDAALNAGVLRYRADPRPWRSFGADTDLGGRIGVPVLTVHGIGDATAFVELESAFRETMEQAAAPTRLVQTYTEDAEHSYLSDPVYPTLLEALLRLGASTATSPRRAASRSGARRLEAHLRRRLPLRARLPARAAGIARGAALSDPS